MGLSFSQIVIEHSLMYNKDVREKQAEIKKEKEERANLIKEDKNVNIKKKSRQNNKKTYII